MCRSFCGSEESFDDSISQALIPPGGRTTSQSGMGILSSWSVFAMILSGKCEGRVNRSNLNCSCDWEAIISG